MFEQTFDLLDLARVGFLALLEILLSADNAIVLGILVRHLPERLRKRALFIGVVSSLIIRAAALFAVSLLLQAAWIQCIGGLYLLYLAVSHFRSKSKPKTHADVPTTGSFWKTVLLVELYDLAFAVDSIIVAVAFVSAIPSVGPVNPKLWIVYVGASIGILFIRLAANWFSSLIDCFPRMETAAYLMIGWIGLKLSLQPLTGFYEPLFWSVLTILFAIGFTKKKSHV